MKQFEFEALLKSKSKDFDWCQLASEAWHSWTNEEQERATIDDIEADVADTILSIKETERCFLDRKIQSASTRAVESHSSDKAPARASIFER